MAPRNHPRPARRPALRVEPLEDRRTPAIHVAVVGGTNDDSGFVRTVNQLNDDTHFDFTAVLVTAGQVDTAAELADYDAVVIGSNGYGTNGDPFGDAAFTGALRAWAEGGGGVVAVGWTVAAAGRAASVADMRALLPVATNGYSPHSGATFTIRPTGHPVTAGLPNFTLTSGDLTETAVGGADPGATVLANAGGGPSTTAVVAGPIGPAGRGVYAGIVYASVTGRYNTPAIRTGHPDQLLEQAVAWAANYTPPTGVALAANTVAENQPAGTAVGTLAALDPNPADTHTFALVGGPGGADNDAFYVAGNTLYTNRPLDFEAQPGYTVRVRAADPRFGLFAEQALTITLQDAPEGPAALTLSNAAVNENQPVGTVVGSFAAHDPDVGDTFSYALVAGAGDTGNGSFTLNGNVLKTAAVFDYETKPSYGIRVRATDSTNRTIEQVFTVTVENLAGEADNAVPTLSGVPVSVNVNEGDPVSFTATGEDADGDPLTFSLAGAPAAASIDPTTGAFAWATTEADGPDTYVFNVQVTDGLATTVQPVTVVVRETNQAPALAGVPAAATTVRGAAVTFTAAATDPDVLNGESNALTYSLVGAPAGAVIDPDTGEFTWTPDGTVEAGLYPFTVRVTDDGVPARTDTQTISITVADAAVTNGDLLVGGTNGPDVLAVKPTKDKLGLVVTLNRRVLGTFPLADVTGRVVGYGLAGNDKVTVNAKVTVPADLYGGTGNDALTGGAGADRLFGQAGDDKLVGGAGDNLLVGGDGKDVLTGGTGRDVLLGGAGADKLVGGAGDDLLVAGSTTLDADLTGLAAVLAEWTRTDLPYADRVTNLTTGGGLNGTTALSGGTVTDDGLKDVLTGGTGTDWFVTSLGDLFDRKDPEQALTV